MNKTLDEMKMIHEEEMQSYGRIQDRVISVMLSHGCKIVQTPSFEDYDSYGTYFPSLRSSTVSSSGFSIFSSIKTPSYCAIASSFLS